MELVALCDTWEEGLQKAGRALNVATYTDFDQFLAHDLDAVILADYFHQHAPLAIRALGAGKHVMSETAACFTLAEGVALVRAVERSGCTYMFAENYPYMLFNQEMRRLYQAGRIGQFMYGEGEYVHPMDADFKNAISPGLKHWRNWLPATYYCTHALAPLMFITDTRPVEASGFIIKYAPDDPVVSRIAATHDAASAIMLKMDNGALVKLLQIYLRGESIWVRVHGSRGQMENLRHGNPQMVRLRREQFHERRTEPEEQIYLPRFPEHHEAATRAGHGGGDFFMNYHFADAIRRGEQPYLDVYRGVAMSIVGAQAWRSALSGSVPVAVPDFRKPAACRKYEHDDWSPAPEHHKRGQPPASVRGDVAPSPAGLAYARRIWRKNGYKGE
jgi:predicted dehydrogenase